MEQNGSHTREIAEEPGPASTASTPPARADAGAGVSSLAEARRHALDAAQRCSVRLAQLTIHSGTSIRGLDSGEALVTELREAVTGYVRTLKEADHPPEAALVLVKQVISQVEASVDDMDLLRHDAVQWTIDAYFGTDPP